jgi:methyltransferase
MTVAAGLACMLAATAAQRALELGHSRRNLRQLRADAAARGAAVATAESAAGFALLASVQVLLLALPAAESSWFGTRAGPVLAACAWALWGAGQALRLASMRALGPTWNARGAVADGQAVVARGPYRWLRHPNYLGVLLEGFALPLAGGAWRSLLAVNLLLVPITLRRARAEELLLARDPAWRSAFAHLRGFLPRLPR